jgi:hypothetical protein
MKDSPRSPELTHILLTRFNTAVDYAPTSRGIEDAWLRARISLFEQYCLPSVIRQSSRNFSWLVFCDARSPAWFRAVISAYGSILTPIYMEGPATDEAIASAVQKTGLVNTPYLMTTRLDNDDAIGCDYVALAQKTFQRQSRQFLLFPFGLQSFRGQLYNVYWRANPFLTLIEKVRPDGAFTTVLCVPHDKIRSTGQVRELYAAPQWLQVLHGGNLLNSLRGWPRLSSKKPSKFPLNWAPEIQREGLASRFGVAAHSFFDRGLRLARRFKARPAKPDLLDTRK